ncbi:hypothetical protein [Luteimonas panaciterrae]|uniref:hypothetical protein n=1 Tax=Luteimonas panaciterrae TaxID=363885 RepID=UPI001CF94B7F|nr:hypothetical protein [Luteimonas panaciterrae]
MSILLKCMILVVAMTLAGCPLEPRIFIHNDNDKNLTVVSKKISFDIKKNETREIPNNGNSLDRNPRGEMLLRIKDENGSRCYIMLLPKNVPADLYFGTGRVITVKLIASRDNEVYIIPHLSNLDDFSAVHNIKNQPKLLSCVQNHQ